MTTASRGLTMVRASAGSGKTHRLTTEVCEAVAAEARVDGLVAVTFTTRAAAELEARIHQSLVRARAFGRVHRLPLAYVGTVHAVCLRLVQELAIEAGLSPRVDVLPDDGGKLLREALEWALAPSFLTRMDALAVGLAVEQESRKSRVNWIWPVAEVMELARQNRISAEALGGMGERSAAELCALLPAPLDGAALDGRLRAELEAARAWVGRHRDGTKGTASACREVQEVLCADDGQRRPPWPVWLKLASLEPTKASADLFAPLEAAAADYERHPDFRADLGALTAGVFEAARLGLRAFDRWKRERGLVDYVDMIDQAVGLLHADDVADRLRARLDMVVVDEFQDTSPLHLALFARLHRLVGRSTWVGDRKQCIFEFAGADPLLIDSVAEWAAREGGRIATLDQNRRSRPELVRACSALFSAAFERFGYPQDEVEVAPYRQLAPELAILPPLGLWWLDAGSIPEEAAAIAEGVRRILEAPAETPVEDRATGQVRPARPGDVAVLVDTNDRADTVATALQARGITVAHARAGLLSTPEGTVVDAALRWLLDERDRLSEAVLEALHGFGGMTADEWLADRLRRTGEEEPQPSRPEWQTRLDLLRDRLESLAPSEALDLTLDALDSHRLVSAWPEPSQRRANLDALRAMARAYEDRSAQRREAATVAGLLRAFDEARTPVVTREGDRARDDQHLAAGDHAVTISTYHKAKGLEWPIVVMGSLDRRERRTAFGVLPESEAVTFDPADPLSGRRIRYWPRPFGNAKPPLFHAAARSPQGLEAAAREDHERVRLLYVGMTRARDHLVLAIRLAKGKPKAAWLDDLRDAQGPLLGLAAAVGEGSVALPIRGRGGRSTSVEARAWRLGVGATPPVRLERRERHHWFARPSVGGAARARYGIAPSNVADDWPDLPPTRVEEVLRLGEPLAVLAGPDLDWSEVGHAAHDYLAADDPRFDAAERARRAERVLAARGLTGRIRADALTPASDRLFAWASSRWPGATWNRELPIEAKIEAPAGTRLLSGRIDLLLETHEGLVVIDHKTFPASHESAWRMAAREHGGQLVAYASALARVDPRPVVAMWLHFVLGGGLVRISARP